jgi:hypothetical protein
MYKKPIPGLSVDMLDHADAHGRGVDRQGGAWSNVDRCCNRESSDRRR